MGGTGVSVDYMSGTCCLLCGTRMTWGYWDEKGVLGGDMGVVT